MNQFFIFPKTEPDTFLCKEIDYQIVIVNKNAISMVMLI